VLVNRKLECYRWAQSEEKRKEHHLLVMWWCQSFNGKLNFATDAWTLPNHKVYVALTVHLKCKGNPLSMLLDVVEVLKTHSGVNLAIAFAEVLWMFGIGEKVLVNNWDRKDKERLTIDIDSQPYGWQCLK
jgi:hypothetical protein